MYVISSVGSNNNGKIQIILHNKHNKIWINWTYQILMQLSKMFINDKCSSIHGKCSQRINLFLVKLNNELLKFEKI